jgi:glycosyltransferase involved in cell wall biosynthesis
VKISVIIPTYNREAQVVRAISSVFAQSVPVDEVIVVDDGSTDKTVSIVRKEFGKSVTLIEQQNQGVSVARNRGIEAAKFEWVAFLDSDDFWMEEKINLQLEALRLGESDIGLCFTDNRYWGNPDMEFSRFEETGFQSSSKFGVLERPINYILTGREPFFTSTLLIRRSLLMEYGGFDDKLIIREDTDLLFRLALKTAFAFVGKPLVFIDRTPTREEGLCKLYGTRIDTLFECSKRVRTVDPCPAPPISLRLCGGQDSRAEVQRGTTRAQRNKAPWRMVPHDCKELICAQGPKMDAPSTSSHRCCTSKATKCGTIRCCLNSTS